MGVAWGAAPSPLGRGAGGLGVLGHQCSHFPSLRGKSCTPKPPLYILGLFWPCGAVSCPGGGVLQRAP